MLKNKTIWSLIAAILGLLSFFFAFMVVSGWGASMGMIGFGVAFEFANFGCVMVFLALLVCVAGIVLTFLKMSKISMLLYAFGALCCLLSIFTIGAGSYGMAGAGIGNWLAMIFLLAAFVLEFLNLPLPIIPIPGLNADAGRRAAPRAAAYRPASQAAGSFCPNCGAKCAPGVKFCPGCGAKR